MSILNVASDIIKLIKGYGLDAEVVVHEIEKTSISIRHLKLEEMSKSKNCIIGVRAIANKYKSACISFNNFSSLSKIVERVVTMAKNAQEDKYLTLALPNQFTSSAANLNILDKTLITIENLKEIAQSAESSALSYHKNITNSEGAQSSYSITNITLITSNGFLESFSKSVFSNQVAVIAGKENDMKVGYDYSVACNFDNLFAPETLGKEAAKRALDQLKSRKVKTCKVPVIFERRAASELLKNFATAINGNNIANKTSFLRDSMDKQIFRGEVDIVDDPFMVGGVASRPFDGEGIAGEKNILVKNGILKSWILDLYSAKKLGLHTTGNAIRNVNATLSPGASNLYIKNGNVPPEELMQDIKEGLYVTDLFGFGVNLINGNYSQGACGFWISGGKIVYSVSEVTVAGSLLDMFSNLSVADDLTFCGAINSPTVKVSEMTVAGTSI
ncbi:MAG: modulator protein [Candidatus Mesenet longicola]|uniref:Modulator protein n=1 Tax=Candidatus Mesenet longicola TaxID=1892558 RepID=A0A8J3HVX3_9RICK|nr:MAG: modulator protein [Candidatus Mesenet longicola]GHM59969.1 MAG: modulator protein [Candidatus Mesenet longicola]